MNKIEQQVYKEYMERLLSLVPRDNGAIVKLKADLRKAFEREKMSISDKKEFMKLLEEK